MEGPFPDTYSEPRQLARAEIQASKSLLRSPAVKYEALDMTGQRRFQRTSWQGKLNRPKLGPNTWLWDS